MEDLKIAVEKAVEALRNAENAFLDLPDEIKEGIIEKLEYDWLHASNVICEIADYLETLEQ